MRHRLRLYPRSNNNNTTMKLRLATLALLHLVLIGVVWGRPVVRNIRSTHGERCVSWGLCQVIFVTCGAISPRLTPHTTTLPHYLFLILSLSLSVEKNSTAYCTNMARKLDCPWSWTFIPIRVVRVA
jgi:hypothetical protein